MQRPDIAVYDPGGRLQLVVEVKARPGTTPDWAAEFRRNLLSHQAIPNAPFFLLAFPDVFYLWRSDDNGDVERPPDYRIDARELLRAHRNGSIPPLDRLGGFGLELVVQMWLEEITRSNLTEQNVEPSMWWLLESGLYEQIRNGSVTAATTA